MRKLFEFMMTSLDGYHEGPAHELDWHNADNPEFNRFAVEQLAEADTLVFGRVTYEMMASYWPTSEAYRSDPDIAGPMNDLPKLVASRTLERVDWANARLLEGDAVERLAELRAGTGGGLLVLGSADLTASLLRAGILDELRVMVSPVVLGAGVPAFQGADRTSLELVSARPYASGNVLLTYRPIAS